MSSSSEHNVLITAASGNIGKCLTKLLLDTPTSVVNKIVLPTRNKSRLLSALPHVAEALAATAADSSVRVRIIVPEGDVSDPIFLEEQLRAHSVNTVLFNFTGMDELVVTLNSFDAARRAGTVSHVVYVSAAGDFSPQAIMSGALKYVDAGHVAVKFITEQKLANGGLPYTSTVLGPTAFYSNDLRSRARLLRSDAEGGAVFDAPIPERGVSRVDPQDIALAAFNAIKDRGERWAGKKITIGSKKLYSAADVGELWSEAIGRKVAMPPNTLDYLNAFEKDFFDKIGCSMAWARDHSLMYVGFFEQTFYVQTDEEYQLQVELLGKEPSDYEEWVKKVGAEMKKGSSS